MAVRITTLNENGVNSIGAGYLLAEWGLSILIETAKKKILFDTGRTITVSNNAPVLGVDLNKVDKIVLSHGHHDHAGGLREVLRQMHKEVEVIAHPDVWSAKYSQRKGRAARFIGIPHRRVELEGLGARFTMTKTPIDLGDGVMTTGEIPMVTDYEKLEPYLMVKEGGEMRQDPLNDDLAMIIKTQDGLAVILGCAHHGTINTLLHAQKLTGIKKIHTVIGGSHLVDTSKERLIPTIAALKEIGVEKLGLCHCTSLSVCAILAREFGDGFFFNSTGIVVDLP